MSELQTTSFYVSGATIKYLLNAHKYHKAGYYSQGLFGENVIYKAHKDFALKPEFSYNVTYTSLIVTLLLDS